MRFLRLTKWGDYQHYHDGRRPVWIKLYTALLNPALHPKHATLSDLAKLTLYHLWLLAAECNNLIPETWLTRDRLCMQSKPRIDEIITAGIASFSRDDNDSQSRGDKELSSSPHVSVSVSSSRSSTKELTDWQETAFMQIWKEYPRRVGRKGALKHFAASVHGPDDLDLMRKALANYMVSSEYRRGYIQHGSTWFNNWRDWVDYEESNGAAKAGPPVGVTVDDVRDIDWHLKQTEWAHPLCTRLEAQAWRAHLDVVGLPNAWPLADYVAARRVSYEGVCEPMERT